MRMAEDPRLPVFYHIIIIYCFREEAGIEDGWEPQASCIPSFIVSEKKLAMRMAEDPRLPASCILSLILHQPSMICPRQCTQLR